MNRKILIDLFSSIDWKQKLEKLLENAEQINQKTQEDGWTLIHYAIDVENHEAVKWLAAKGADINIKNDDGCTPLHWAVFCDLDMAISCDLPFEFCSTRFLLSIGADPSIKDNNGNLPRDLAGHYGVDIQEQFDHIAGSLDLVI